MRFSSHHQLVRLLLVSVPAHTVKNHLSLPHQDSKVLAVSLLAVPLVSLLVVLLVSMLVLVVDTAHPHPTNHQASNQAVA